MSPRALAWALLLAAARPLVAQDSHYWSETYGTQATLLGGVVVGRVPDLSAAFYNPGRLAFAQGPAISLNTRVYQIESLTIGLSQTRYVGSGELGATDLRPSPSFAGGVLPVGDRKRFVMAYTFLSRQSQDVRINSTSSSGNPVATSSELFFQRQVNESWYGLSLGYRLSPKAGIGGTLFGAYRSQFQRGQLTAQGDSTPPQATSTTRQHEYYDLRLIAKVGISVELGGWGVGAAVTTPGLHVLGSGSAYFAQVTTPGGVQNAWRSDSSPDVQYRSSWSVAGGVARTFGKATAYATAEWFAPVAKYVLLAADSVYPTDGRPAFVDDLVHERQAVLDWGLGLQYRTAENRAVYAHFTVDKPARPRNTGVNTTYDRWGTYHAGGGYAFRLGHWDLVTGLAYSWGGDTFVAGQSDTPPGGSSIPAGASAKVTERRLRVLVGFDVRF